MRLSFSDIAIHWLRDLRRLNEGWINVIDEDGRDRLALFQGHLTGLLDRALARERIDDISILVADFFALNRSLPQWWQAAMHHRGVSIGFEDREPIVAVQSYMEWKHISDRLDVDGMIALSYAVGYRVLPDGRALDRWGVYPVAEDRWVRRTLGKERNRLFDLHTHLEGCEAAPYLWQKILDGSLKQRHLPEYSRSKLRSLRNATELEALERETSLVFIEATAAFRSLLEMVDVAYGQDGTAAYASCPPSVVAGRLWVERMALVRAWHCLQPHVEHQDDVPRPWMPWQHELGRSLDRYLVGKQRFVARQTQTQGGNPGLANFRRYFDRMKVTHAARSPRRVWKRRFRLVSTALESPRLDGIELRIAAFERQADYVRFFRKWQKEHGGELDKRLPARQGRQTVAFVVHFIRWQPHFARVHDPVLRAERIIQRVERVREEGVRAVLDRQTAALHEFRWKHPDLARDLVGIDVANLERLNPVAAFTPYLRLLRGVGSATLANRPQTPVQADDRLGFEASPFLRSWRRLRDAGRLAPTYDLPRLGLTYHAGEDYYHPLDGVRAVWEVLRRLEASEGDRIGHGMALGDDPFRFARTHANGGTVPQGEVLDTLVWAHRRLGALPGVDARAMRVMEDEIATLCMEIYGHSFPLGSLQLVQWLKHRPFVPVMDGRRWYSDAGPDERWLYAADMTDEIIRERRMLHVGLPRLYFDPLTLAELDKVVTSVLDQLQRKKVVIEVNPTSNLCVGGLDRYSDHPIFRIIRRNEGVRFVICCDDPGTFATRIENEYAAMLDAVRDLDAADQGLARQAIEAAVATAQEAAFQDGW